MLSVRLDYLELDTQLQQKATCIVTVNARTPVKGRLAKMLIHIINLIYLSLSL